MSLFEIFIEIYDYILMHLVAMYHEHKVYLNETINYTKKLQRHMKN